MAGVSSVTARVCGGAAGFGCLLAGILHEGFGGPMLDRLLAAQAEAAPALLQQTDAAWMSATLSLVLFGAVLLAGAFRRPAWLSSLGIPIGLWLAGYGAAEQWGAARWGVSGIAPETVILWVLAALTFAAALLSRPARS